MKQRRKKENENNLRVCINKIHLSNIRGAGRTTRAQAPPPAAALSPLRNHHLELEVVLAFTHLPSTHAHQESRCPQEGEGRQGGRGGGGKELEKPEEKQEEEKGDRTMMV